MASYVTSLLLAAVVSKGPDAGAKPNVLVLFADDLGFNQINLPGQPIGYSGVDGAIKTPV